MSILSRWSETMGPPVLYTTDVSPPCRAVLLTAAAAGIELELKETSLFEKEHLSPDFLKMNPQHTIPTLDDNGFILWDSHAIITYLVDKYAKNDALYPKDLQKRATINQRLHFDNSVLFTNLKNVCYPVVFEGDQNVNPKQIAAFTKAFECLEKILGDNNWFAGDHYTLADISLAASISSILFFHSLDKFPKLAAWLQRCEKELPNYAKMNGEGNELIHQVLRQYLPNYQSV